MKKTIYLDNASTSFPKPKCMIKGIEKYLQVIGGNPNRGSHKLSVKGNHLILETRKILSKFLGITNFNKISFTYNATYALNLLLKGFLKPSDHVIISSYEHNSVLRPLHYLKKEKNISYNVWNCDAQGDFDLNELKKLIKKNTRLFFFSHCSNVLGTFIPIKEVTKIAKDNNIYLGLDCTQSVGHRPLGIEELGVDFVAATGHKALLGPSGIGILYVKDSNLVDTIIHGSGGYLSSTLEHPNLSPLKYEAGTINYLGIAGLKESLDWLWDNNIALGKKYEQLISYILEEFKKIPQIKIYGETEVNKRIPLISFNIDTFFPSEVEMILDQKYNIIVRSGLHCSPLIHKCLKTEKNGTVRISLGPFIEESDIKYFIKVIKKLIER